MWPYTATALFGLRDCEVAERTDVYKLVGDLAALPSMPVMVTGSINFSSVRRCVAVTVRLGVHW